MYNKMIKRCCFAKELTRKPDFPFSGTMQMHRLNKFKRNEKLADT